MMALMRRLSDLPLLMHMDRPAGKSLALEPALLSTESLCSGTFEALLIHCFQPPFMKHSSDEGLHGAQLHGMSALSATLQNSCTLLPCEEDRLQPECDHNSSWL